MSGQERKEEGQEKRESKEGRTGGRKERGQANSDLLVGKGKRREK